MLTLSSKDAVSQYQLRTRRPIEAWTQEEWRDWQIKRLLKRLGTKFVSQKDLDFFASIPAVCLGETNFALIPTPPKVIDFHDLMARCELDGVTGMSCLGPVYHKDLVPVISTASVLVDLCDGNAPKRLSLPPPTSRENLEREGRTGLLTYQGIIAFGILFPWSLRDHGVDNVLSRYGSCDYSCLYLNGDKQPVLGVSLLGSYSGSYGSVIVP
jgi:hypothetical protein